MLSPMGFLLWVANCPEVRLSVSTSGHPVEVRSFTTGLDRQSATATGAELFFFLSFFSSSFTARSDNVRMVQDSLVVTGYTRVLPHLSKTAAARMWDHRHTRDALRAQQASWLYCLPPCLNLLNI